MLVTCRRVQRKWQPLRHIRVPSAEDADSCAVVPGAGTALDAELQSLAAADSAKYGWHEAFAGSRTSNGSERQQTCDADAVGSAGVAATFETAALVLTADVAADVSAAVDKALINTWGSVDAASRDAEEDEIYSL